MPGRRLAFVLPCSVPDDLEIHDGGLIVAVAAPAEARAVLSAFGSDLSLVNLEWRLHRVAQGIEVLVTGVGKVNAAGALARVLEPRLHKSVLSLGVAGALPGSNLAIGDVVVGEKSVYADEGLLSPDGFSDCAAMGFAPGPGMSGMGVVHDLDWAGRLQRHANRSGVIATVSTCSGTDRGAETVVERTGAIAEAMEGAAIGQVAARLGVCSAEVRVISNTTGDRARQVWDLDVALSVLSRFVMAALVR